MDKIEESVEMLLQVIRGSEVYMDYKKQEEDHVKSGAFR